MIKPTLEMTIGKYGEEECPPSVIVEGPRMISDSHYSFIIDLSHFGLDMLAHIRITLDTAKD